MSTEIIYLDLETTGLYPESDEILEIGILSDNDTVLLNTYIKPVHNTTWPEAQWVNKISPDDVKNAPLLDEIRPKIVECVKDKIVVIYNADFGFPFLEAELKLAKEIKCCMLEFAPVYDEWDEYWESYTWQKLTTAAKYVIFQWEKNRTHSAIGDCKATRAVWHYLTVDIERQRIDAIKRKEREEQEIEREVNRYLRQLECDKFHEQEKFLEDANSFWTQRILGKDLPIKCSVYFYGIKASPVKGNEIQKQELEDMYHILFTGFPKKVWEKLRRYKDANLPIYRKRKDIPDHLVVFSKLKALNWILDKMTPAAGFLSTSGKTINELYDVNDIEKIRETRPNRYESWENVPHNLKSKTRLKQEYKVNVEKEGLQPIADVQIRTPNGIEYIPLYRIPKEVLKNKKVSQDE